MSNQIDILEEITNLREYQHYIFMTFNFTPSFFENYILPYCNQNSRPLILMDYVEYQKIMSRLQSTLIGSRYLVESITVGHKFHPKLVLCLSVTELFLLIGSNNLTREGYSSNLECVISIKMHFSLDESILILEDLIPILSDIQKFTPGTAYQQNIEQILQILKSRELPRTSPERNSWILANTKISLLNQVKSIIKDEILSITILCPYFSQDQQIFEDFASWGKKVRIIVQNQTSNLPTRQLNESENLEFQILKIKQNEPPRILHAKMLVIHTLISEYLLYGSANFSKSALELSALEGNFEIAILSKMKQGFFQKFLKNIGIVEDTTLKQIETTEIEIEEELPNFGYKIVDAYILDNILHVTIDSNVNKSGVTVIIGDSKMLFNCELNDGKIHHILMEKELESLNDWKTISLRIDGEISDTKIVYNPHRFPSQFFFLDSLDPNDREWLFKILNRLLEIPTSKHYIELVEKLVDENIFDNESEREILLRKLCGKLHYIKPKYDRIISPLEAIKPLIYRLIKRNSNRFNSLNKEPVSNLILSFIYTNKLILWAIQHSFLNIFELSQIKRNLELLCSNSHEIFRSYSKSKKQVIDESKIRYHCYCLIFIIDYMQNHSPDFRSKTFIKHIKRNSVKEQFEESSSNAIKFLERIFNENINILFLQETKIEYERFLPELAEIPPNAIFVRITELEKTQ